MNTFAFALNLVSNFFTILASGIAIYVFVVKRKDLSLAIKLLINHSFQTTLTELKEKLERLNEYNANEPTDLPDVINILHEIGGQIKGNEKLCTAAPQLVARIENFANGKRITEAKKRSLVSEIRELLKNIQINSINTFSGDSDE